MDILDCLNDMLSNSSYYNRKYDIKITGSAPQGTSFVVIKKEYIEEFTNKLQEFNMMIEKMRKNENKAIKSRETAEEMLHQAKGHCTGGCDGNCSCHNEKESSIKKSNGESSSFYFPLGNI